MILKKSLLAIATAVLSTTLWAGAGHHHDHDMMDSKQDAGMDHSAHGMMHGQGSHQASPAGTAGKADQVTRTIKVDALDTMMYKHEPITVKAGETIKFEVTNKGKIAHEFGIGVAAEHVKHQEMMRQMPDMKHDDPNVVTLEPGQTKTLIWTFAKAAEIQVACNIPGHYEAGMHSQVQVD